MHPLRKVYTTRYIQPLREGGSLPALVEADDAFKYVLKFRGSGHGVKTLIAELLGGEIARALGLKVPELVFAELDEDFGRTEGDEEIQDLLKASKGLNLALHFLSGAITFDPVVTTVDPVLASKIIWLDAMITNADRTFRNTNMLMWNRELWLIDHGTCLYFHYNWEDRESKAKAPLLFLKDHVLLSQSTEIEKINSEMKKILTLEKLRERVNLIPDDWLHWEETDQNPDRIRDEYFYFLKERLDYSDNFTQEILNAGKTLI